MGENTYVILRIDKSKNEGQLIFMRRDEPRTELRLTSEEARKVNLSIKRVFREVLASRTKTK